MLRRNEIAVMITDEYRRGNGIPTAFFGRTVLARRGPATLASRTGAAVVPACLVRQPDDTLRLVIEPELELARSGKGKAEIAENILAHDSVAGKNRARLSRSMELDEHPLVGKQQWAEIRSQRSEVRKLKADI